MLRTSNLSVVGLYTYDPTIFDGFNLPEGMDRETLVLSLVADLAELELLYPDGELMRRFIPVWSGKELPVWEKMWATTKYEYDPISNYDRTEEWNVENTHTESGDVKDVGVDSYEKEGNGTDSQNATISSTSTFNSSDTETAKNTSSNQGNTTNKVSAFNDSDFSNKDMSVEQSSGETNVSNTKTGGGGASGESENESLANYSVDESGSRSISNDRTFTKSVSDTITKSTRAYGNIGVTTTQQMIEQERNIVQFNIYDFIINSFKNRFCILVY